MNKYLNNLIYKTNLTIIMCKKTFLLKKECMELIVEIGSRIPLEVIVTYLHYFRLNFLFIIQRDELKGISFIKLIVLFYEIFF